MRYNISNSASLFSVAFAIILNSNSQFRTASIDSNVAFSIMLILALVVVHLAQKHYECKSIGRCDHMNLLLFTTERCMFHRSTVQSCLPAACPKLEMVRYHMRCECIKRLISVIVIVVAPFTFTMHNLHTAPHIQSAQSFRKL